MSSFRLFGDFATQEEIDREYQIAATREDIMRARDRSEQLSLATRSRLKTIERVAYGQTRAEHLDIFPAAQERAPVFIFFHGGFWRAMSSSDYSFVADGLNPLGFVTISVNYELAPRVKLDEIVRQSRAAVAWVSRNIERYGGNANCIAIGGHSAGGHLAAMCMLTDWEDNYGLNADTIKAALLISGLFELAPLRYSYLQPKIQLDEEIIARYSPSNLVRSSATPVMLAVGERETSEFRRQTAHFGRLWQAAGNQATYETVPQADHFGAVDPLLNSEAPMCRWLRDTIASS